MPPSLARFPAPTATQIRTIRSSLRPQILFRAAVNRSAARQQPASGYRLPNVPSTRHRRGEDIRGLITERLLDVQGRGKLVTCWVMRIGPRAGQPLQMHWRAGPPSRFVRVDEYPLNNILLDSELEPRTGTLREVQKSTPVNLEVLRAAGVDSHSINGSMGSRESSKTPSLVSNSRSPSAALWRTVSSISTPGPQTGGA